MPSKNSYIISDNIRPPLSHTEVTTIFFLWLIKQNCQVTVDKILMILLMGWKSGLGKSARDWPAIYQNCFLFHQYIRKTSPSIPVRCNCELNFDRWIRLKYIPLGLTHKIPPWDPVPHLVLFVLPGCWHQDDLGMPTSQLHWSWKRLISLEPYEATSFSAFPLLTGFYALG